MTQRLYQGDLEVESLYRENAILRDRLHKMTEIESYVNILLQNNKTYQ